MQYENLHSNILPFIWLVAINWYCGCVRLNAFSEISRRYFRNTSINWGGKKLWKNKQKNKINYLPIRYSFVDIVQNGRETFKIQWFKNHRRFFFFNYSNWSMKILFVFNFKVNKLSKLSVYKYKMNKCTDKLTIQNIINIINV